jgi:hypothetical protein
MIQDQGATAQQDQGQQRYHGQPKNQGENMVETIDVETIRDRLKDRRLYVVAKETGLSYQGILNIFTGVTKNPSSNTMNKLQAYFDANGTSFPTTSNTSFG